MCNTMSYNKLANPCIKIKAIKGTRKARHTAAGSEGEEKKQYQQS